MWVYIHCKQANTWQSQTDIFEFKQVRPLHVNVDLVEKSAITLTRFPEPES